MGKDKPSTMASVLQLVENHQKQQDRFTLVSLNDLEWLIDLAEIRRDQWRGNVELCEVAESPESERQAMVKMLDSLIARVRA